MFRLIDRGLLVLKFISALGWRGLPVAWKLYVGRPGKVVSISLGGHRLFIRKRTSDVAVFRNAFIERECDFTVFPQSASIMERYNEILAGGGKPLVIDCGAHTGLSTIFLVMLFPKATVVALEPAEDNFDLLRRNVAHCESVIPIQAGVWDKSTCLKVANRTAEPFAYQTVECAPADPDAIAAVSIPDLLARFIDSEPLLVKIDVEGAEQALFRSNTAWLERVPLLVVELHDWLLPQQGTSANFLARVAEMPCDFVVRGENVLIFNRAAHTGDGMTQKE
jgi:FkbM family methyltransferase